MESVLLLGTWTLGDITWVHGPECMTNHGGSRVDI